VTYKTRLSVLLTLAVGVVAPTSASARDDAETTNIKTAALAPYVAYIRGDASGLCAAFTVRARSGLAPQASTHRGCVRRVQAVFGIAAHFHTLPLGNVDELSASHIRRRGSKAEAHLSFKLAGRVTFTLDLAREGGRWLVSTMPTLTLAHGCPPDESCRSNTMMPLFTVGTIDDGRATAESTVSSE
jgi:hypothetical protein